MKSINGKMGVDGKNIKGRWILDVKLESERTYRPFTSSLLNSSSILEQPDGKMTQFHLEAVCDVTKSFQEHLEEESNCHRSGNEAMRGPK